MFYVKQALSRFICTCHPDTLIINEIQVYKCEEGYVLKQTTVTINR